MERMTGLWNFAPPAFPTPTNKMIFALSSVLLWKRRRRFLFPMETIILFANWAVIGSKIEVSPKYFEKFWALCLYNLVFANSIYWFRAEFLFKFSELCQCCFSFVISDLNPFSSNLQSTLIVLKQQKTFFLGLLLKATQKPQSRFNALLIGNVSTGFGQRYTPENPKTMIATTTQLHLDQTVRYCGDISIHTNSMSDLCSR